MVVAFAVLAGLVGLVDLWAVVRGHHIVEHWAKPATVPLMALAAISGGAFGHTAGVWLIVAAFMSALGDIALLGDATLGSLKSGVGAFALAHLAYVVVFVTLGLHSPGLGWVAGAIMVALLWLTRDLLPRALRVGGPGLAVPLAAYSLVIGAMLVTGWMTGSILIAAGATIFALSDSTLARNLTWRDFRQPTGGAALTVMVTYFLGQALLIAGVMHAL